MYDTSRALTIVSGVPALATQSEHEQDTQRALMEAIARAANAAAAQSELERYQSTKSPHTLRRQRADIMLFTRYLATTGMNIPFMSCTLTLSLGEQEEQSEPLVCPVCPALHCSLASWSFISHGLVQGFVLWQLKQGYALGSIAVRLATIKSYARLASRAGHIKPEVYTLIKTVEAYSAGEGRRVDEKRAETRRPHAKKAEPVEVSVDVVSQVLKSIDASTKKGRRDRLLISLLFELGLRCGEVAALDVASVDREANTITVTTLKSRDKDNQDTLEMKRATKPCMQDYWQDVTPDQGPLFTSSLCSAQKTRIDTSTINNRVAVLFKRAGVTRRVGPHDGRHHMATELARKGTDLQKMQEVGRWKTLQMPSLYVIKAKVANAGVDAPDYGL